VTQSPRGLSIKDHPELRHTLAHFAEAIEAVADGQPGLARDHLRSIESAYLYENDDDQARACARREGVRLVYCGKKKKGGRKK
jgi:hypothetical protein